MVRYQLPISKSLPLLFHYPPIIISISGIDIPFSGESTVTINVAKQYSTCHLLSHLLKFWWRLFYAYIAKNTRQKAKCPPVLLHLFNKITLLTTSRPVTL